MCRGSGAKILVYHAHKWRSRALKFEHSIELFHKSCCRNLYWKHSGGFYVSYNNRGFSKIIICNHELASRGKYQALFIEINCVLTQPPLCSLPHSTQLQIHLFFRARRFIFDVLKLFILWAAIKCTLKTIPDKSFYKTMQSYKINTLSTALATLMIAWHSVLHLL